MRLVLYTQRVEIVESYGERRDCADQNIPRYLQTCGCLPVPLPNIWEVAREMAQELDPAGIVLTGGNSLVKYGGDAPERDKMEKNLLEYAIRKQIPVYGFCRGMQMILDYFGCELEDVEGHISVRHEIKGKMGEQNVNSYHKQACRQVKEPLEVLAAAEDGIVEAVAVKRMPILATMWHPERELKFRESDILLIKDLFGREDG